MKKLLLICSIILLGNSFLKAQVTIYSEDFDTPDVDMSTYQLFDGADNAQSFNIVGADYIQRNVPSTFTAGNGPVTGMTGKAIGCEDVDGAGFFGIPYIKTNAINITNYTSLTLSLRVGAPYGNWASGTRYEGTDGLDVEYRIDGGAWQQAHLFQAAGSGPGQHFWYDAAGNGITGTGDDIGVNSVSQAFTRSLVGTGSTLEVRVRMNSFGSQEEFVFDDIIVKGIAAVCTDPDIPVITSTPSIICPGSSSTLTWTGNLNDATAWHVYTSSCGVTQLTTTTSNSLVVTPGATTTYYIRGEDGAGCVDESTGLCGSVTVIVQDITNPTITCPADQNESVNVSCQFSLPDYTGLAIASDNCGAVIVTQLPIAGTLITGATVVTLTVDDGNGNTASCNFNAIGVDNINPPIVCPANQNESFDATCNFTLLDYTGLAVVADNCNPAPAVTQSPIAGTVISSTTTITLTVNDGSGNTANCTFDVIPTDNTNPTITCPGNQTETVTALCNFTLPDYTGLVAATDNCNPSPIVTQSPIAGTVITANATITMTADDGNGNTSTCTFDVNLDMSGCNGTECSNAITVGPFPICGGSQTETGSTVGGTISTETAFCGTSVGSGGVNWYTFTGDGGNWTTSTVSGGTNYDTKIWIYEGACGVLNCVTGNDDFSGVQSQVSFPTTVGTEYYVIVGGYSANEGNYELTLSNVEAVAPVADVATLNDINGVCEITTLTEPTATDNCTAVTVTNDATLPITTSTTIMWTYTDVAGNFSTQIQNVVLADLIAPTVTCPGNQTETPDASCQFILPDYTGLATATDNCAGTPVVTQLPAAGTVISGTTTITMTATDGSSNTAQCTFDVVLNDATAPTAVCQNINAYLDGSGNATIVATDLDGGSTDNCSGLTFSASQTAFTCADLGPNNVTLTVTDGNSNTDNCVAVVTVIDTISPVVNCLGNQTDIATTACQFTLPDYTVAATVFATDNCTALPTITQSPNAGTAVGLGVTTITLTADDGNGNTSTCNFTVTISSSATGTLDSTICNGGSFMYNGTLYDGANTSGVETLTGAAANGCDSIVTVTVTELPAIDITVTNASPVLTANQTGASYRWLDCDNSNAVIPTETNQSYTATSNGNYAVEITDGTCVDTSVCINVIISGIEVNPSTNQLTIYPNPTKGIFTIDLAGVNENTSITVYDVLGKVIVNQKLIRTKTLIDLTGNKKGIYFINIQSDNEKIVRKIILQ
ncbi:MAG: HYR domain-containing protein [Flavobacteriales bacterium]|nr:HYR domain-containing protein [Flavobacteriales bacterium]